LGQRRKKILNIPRLPSRDFAKLIVFTLLLFFLLSPFCADQTQCIWKDVKKIVAVGDVHGDYDNFVKILKAARIVDESLHWIAGQTHFVQTGDIIDRGDNARLVYDMIKRLETEAEEAGGKVHMLIGNHEELNITGVAIGQPGYVTPYQFASFLPDKLREKKENEFRKSIENQVKEGTNSDPALIEAFLETKWQELMKDKKLQVLYTDTFNENYGEWIIEHNAAVKINDIIFVHGGINLKYSTWSLQEINETLRKELTHYRLAYKRGIAPRIDRKILYQPDSPLWYRDFAIKNEKSYKKIVGRILKNLEANCMVIAHTPRGSAIVPEHKEEISRFDQRIWMIDTGISDFYFGILSYLLIENGKFSLTAWRDEEVESVQEEVLTPRESIEEETKKTPQEYYLLRAKIVAVEKDTVPGRTGAWKVTLDDGTTRKRAFFKHVHRNRPTLLPDSYSYEIAAYELDKLLDLQRIPPAVAREIDGVKGSLQLRIENCFPLDEQRIKKIRPPNSKTFENDLEEINVFENLTYCERKELDDILINKKDWKVWRLDFSEAFSPTPKLISGQNIVRCSKKLFNNLQKLKNEAIKEELKSYINEEEISALIKRKNLIIETIKNLIEEKGEDSVLF
jgi:hypothetical protein